jgi:hypothetical protein
MGRLPLVGRPFMGRVPLVGRPVMGRRHSALKNATRAASSDPVNVMLNFFS